MDDKDRAVTHYQNLLALAIALGLGGGYGPQRVCAFCRRPMPSNHPHCASIMQMDLGVRL